jgi:hypothetical protein
MFVYLHRCISDDFIKWRLFIVTCLYKFVPISILLHNERERKLICHLESFFFVGGMKAHLMLWGGNGDACFPEIARSESAKGED